MRVVGFVPFLPLLCGCILSKPYTEPDDVCEMRIRDKYQFYEVCDPRTYPEDPTKRQYCREINTTCK